MRGVPTGWDSFIGIKSGWLVWPFFLRVAFKREKSTIIYVIVVRKRNDRQRNVSKTKSGSNKGLGARFRCGPWSTFGQWSPRLGFFSTKDGR